MGRFGRQQTEDRNLPAQLGRETEELRTVLERHVRATLEAAEAHAAEVRREADRYATKAQHESEARAQEVLETTFAGAERVLDSIELIEKAVSGMLGALRAELADMAPPTFRRAPESVPSPEELPPAVEEKPTLAGAASAAPNQAEVQTDETESPAEQEEAVGTQRASAEESQEDRDAHKLDTADELDPSATLNQAEVQTDGTESPAEQGEAVGARSRAAEDAHAPRQQQLRRARQAGQEQPAIAPPAASEGCPEAPHDDASVDPGAHRQEDRAAHSLDTAGELDRLIRGRITQMVQEGKPRAEVARFLTRFKLGEQYLEILDQFYVEPLPNGPSQRRGILKRLRRRGR